MIWAILAIIVILGTIVVMASLTIARTDGTQSTTNKLRSSLWVQAASSDLAARINSREIGYAISYRHFNGDLWVDVPVPTGGPASSRTTYDNAGWNGGSPTAARALTVTAPTGEILRGWYQVLPVGGAMSGGWRARYVRDPARPDARGSYEILVRVWEDGTAATATTAQLTFRARSFARFSVLADDRLQLGGVGTLDPGGLIHTNNGRNPAQTAITLGAALSPDTERVTSSFGAINGAGFCGGKCVANVRDTIDFGAATQAMTRVAQLAALPATPLNYQAEGIARSFTGLIGGQPSMPVWWVDLSSTSCSDGDVLVGTGRFPLRRDVGGIPLLNDALAPLATLTGGTCRSVAEGGGAFLFDGDVVVQGLRSGGDRPITLMARRNTSLTAQVDTDGNGVADVTTRVSSPASIFIVQDSDAAVGSSVPLAPVGLVAEGGVYAPSWYMNAGRTNHDLVVLNVAATAASGEIGYGPSIASVAADANGPGLGLLPATARSFGYGVGRSMSWTGALASRRSIVFRYGTGAAWLGYGTRDISYADDLSWNPPPLYPSDKGWYMSDFREFRGS